MHTKQIYIGVIGGRDCSAGVAEAAYHTGRLIALEGWVLVCGGMGGVMEMACKGASQYNGVSLGILPAGLRSDGNPYLSYSIVTGLGEARNSIVVKTCHAMIAIAGSFGTLSEIAFARINGIPVVGLHTWEVDAAVNDGRQLLSAKAESADDAVNLVRGFLKQGKQ